MCVSQRRQARDRFPQPQRSRLDEEKHRPHRQPRESPSGRNRRSRPTRIRWRLLVVKVGAILHYGRTSPAITCLPSLRRPSAPRVLFRAGTGLRYSRLSVDYRSCAGFLDAGVTSGGAALCAKNFKRSAGWRAFRQPLKLCRSFRPAVRKLIFLRASRRLARRAIIREESQTGLKCPIRSSRGLRSERVCENSL